MKNKKVILAALLIVVISMAFAGCGKTPPPASDKPAGTGATEDSPASNSAAFPAFEAKDLSDEAVNSSSLFASNKITMVNIWGTFCGPCIDEMPDLAAMSKDMPEGSAIVGLICDAMDNETITRAKEIVAETGVEYQNIIPDKTLFDYIADNISAVPTTLFIDAEGKIVGDAVIGSQEAKEYIDAIQSRLSD
jgi:thiol-disulfide isomerase/thioredoxin